MRPLQIIKDRLCLRCRDARMALHSRCPLSGERGGGGGGGHGEHGLAIENSGMDKSVNEGLFPIS